MAEVQALVQLLSTGQAPLPSAAPAPPTAPLVRLLSLADVLGLSLTGLTARTSQGRVIHIQEQSKDNIQPPACLERSKTPPLPDSQKFRRHSQQQEKVKMRQAAILDGDPSCSNILAERGLDQRQSRSEELLERTQSLKLAERFGEERHFAKPADRRLLKSPENGSGSTSAKPSLLSSRKTTKPASSVQNSQHSLHFPFLRPRSPNSPPPGPQARVIMSDTALIDLMEIKKEVVDDEVVAELEGREDELSDEGEDEEYPDMDNYGRNYVCCKCAKGFTFAKSFNWHSSRCEGGESRGRGTENSLGKREAAVHKTSGNVDSGEKRKKVEASRDETPLRQRSVTPQAKERIVISKGNAAKKTALSKRERSITPRGKVTLSKIQLAGPSPRRKDSEKKIQLKKKISGRSESKSPPEKKPKRKKSGDSSTGKSTRSPPETKRQQKLDVASKHSTLSSNRSKGGLIRKKINLAKKVVLKKNQKEVAAAAIGRPVRGSCGRCVKCRMPDCGKCPACVVGNTVQGLRGCVRKVCRNKGRRSVRGST